MKQNGGHPQMTRSRRQCRNTHSFRVTLEPIKAVANPWFIGLWVKGYMALCVTIYRRDTGFDTHLFQVLFLFISHLMLSAHAPMTVCVFWGCKKLSNTLSLKTKKESNVQGKKKNRFCQCNAVWSNFLR